jgi:transposase-like protein
LPLYPKYQPLFSQEEIQKAQDINRKHTAPQAQANRARLVLLLADNPQRSSPSCARELSLHEQTVRKWRKRWTLEEFTLDDKPRCGRNWDFSPSAEGNS